MSRISELFSRTGAAGDGAPQERRSLTERFNDLGNGLSKEQMLLLVRLLALAALVCAVVYGYMLYKNLTS